MSRPTLTDIIAGVLREHKTAGCEYSLDVRDGSKHRPVSDPLCTVTASGNHHGLVTTYYGKGAAQTTDDALPTVISRACFSTVVLGNRREQVRMAGNAVTPPAARDLVGVVAESLAVS